MQRVESYDQQSDQHMQLAGIVGRILAVNDIEVELQAFADAQKLTDVAKAPFGASFLAGQLLEVQNERSRINAELVSAGGLPNTYFNTDTQTSEFGLFIAWNGPAPDGSGLHLWRPSHQPAADMTVSVDYFEALRTKYMSPPEPIGPDWRMPQAYL